MTLDQLNYLLVLAEEQNVTRAAQRLYITQPTLTTFITKLERELGTKLFDRSRNPVRPTKNGELYLKKMQELLLAEQQLKDLPAFLGVVAHHLIEYEVVGERGTLPFFCRG